MKIGLKTSFWEKRDPSSIWFQLILDTLIIAGLGIALFNTGRSAMWIVSVFWVMLRIPTFISYHKWEKQRHANGSR